MITYRTGDMLSANVQALVNTVNTVGVMGKGIALQFAERYKENLRQYKQACKSGELQPGILLVVQDRDIHGDRTIINFPTKKHYRHPSKYEYIETGLKALTKVVRELSIKSIALPPLGCGNGGLDWQVVKEMIQRHLDSLETEVIVYEPSAEVRKILREVPQRTAHLTVARAMLLEALFRYERTGGMSNLFVANKLAYFLLRLGETSLNRLKFAAAHYGPYTDAVGHALYHLNGAFFTGLEQKSAKPFDQIWLDYSKRSDVETYVKNQLSVVQRERLDRLVTLIEGFHATSDLELLSSVAFILEGKPKAGVDVVVQAMKEWSNRKEDLAEPEKVEEAIEHLRSYGREALVFKV